MASCSIFLIDRHNATVQKRAKTPIPQNIEEEIRGGTGD